MMLPICPNCEGEMEIGFETYECRECGTVIYL